MLVLHTDSWKRQFLGNKFEQEMHGQMMKLFRRYFTPLQMFKCDMAMDMQLMKPLLDKMKHLEEPTAFEVMKFLLQALHKEAP